MPSSDSPLPSSSRAKLRAFIESRWVTHSITALIVANAIILGLETAKETVGEHAATLHVIDQMILGLFVLELLTKFYAYGLAFFRNPWNLFDTFVVGIALTPNVEVLSALRALRILRVLRLLSVVPRMRLVVEALLQSLPGLGSIAGLLVLLYYVFAVIATKLFGADFPEWFGTIGESMYSLFQIMTLESWSMGIVRPVMEVYPNAWLFFVPFILIATFTMLNLFIAIIVNSMQSLADDVALERSEAAAAEVKQYTHQDHMELLEEIRSLREEVRALKSTAQQASD